MKLYVSSLAALTLAILTATALNADNTSLRCGNALILIGDTMHEVRSECGEPQSQQRTGERRIYRILKKERLKIEDITTITEWIYEKNQGLYILTFEGSRLTHKTFTR